MSYRIAWRHKEKRESGAAEWCFKTRAEAEPCLERYQFNNPRWEFWIEEEVWPEVIGEDWWPEVIGV
jgi:hypothetical protein